jgi:hypothetical protein
MTTRLSRLELALSLAEKRIQDQLQTENSISDRDFHRYLRINDAYRKEKQYAA